MGRRSAVVLLAVLLGSGAGWWFLRPEPSAAPEVSEAAASIAQGRALYAEFCASCHGANLEGQPDWQTAGPDGRPPAPPHDQTGHTWHHGDALLFEYTRLGGREALALRGVDFDSGMPGFGDQLGDRQIRDILAFIKSTWPERMRAIQAAKTKAEQAGNGE